ncbi:MAG: RES domain-containing protein [Luteitalea sp.]|nr:RES domain-containing protein [Luteitalea sp.]
MILSELAEGTVAYRAHDPKWAIAPTSGAGAARAGGRFNQPGIEALYLSLEDVTALREYQQTSPLLPPCTICSYKVTVSSVVDVRQLHKGPPWDPLWLDWPTDWRHFAFDLHIEPPSWVLGDIVRRAGHGGIVFPSLASPGGTNVALFPDLFSASDLIEAYDLEHRLPKDQSSWFPADE